MTQYFNGIAIEDTEQPLTLRQKLHITLRDKMSADLMNRCEDLQTTTYTHEIVIKISFKGSLIVDTYDIEKMEKLLDAKFRFLSTRKRLLTLYFTQRRLL